jgi:hypothetical protein
MTNDAENTVKIKNDSDDSDVALVVSITGVGMLW